MATSTKLLAFLSESGQYGEPGDWLVHQGTSYRIDIRVKLC